jgi:hypothetical protein
LQDKEFKKKLQDGRLKSSKQQSVSMKKRLEDEDYKIKINTFERNEKISNTIRELWQDPKYRETMIKKQSEGRLKKGNKINE